MHIHDDDDNCDDSDDRNHDHPDKDRVWREERMSPVNLQLAVSLQSNSGENSNDPFDGRMQSNCNTYGKIQKPKLKNPPINGWECYPISG